MRRTLTALVLGLCLVSAPVPASADNTGLWIGGGALSLIYTPVKAGMFLLFGITGGLSYLGTIPAERTDISERWIKLGYYGDWLIRPAHLRGETYPHFVSTSPEVHFVH